MDEATHTAEILAGKICPYCLQPSKLEDSKVVYGRSYGLIYLCSPCHAWVGVHAGTKNALGRLANAKLRELKKSAHNAFDPIWKKGEMKRSKAYLWLAGAMGIDKDLCHIGMFSEDQCRQVIELCKNRTPVKASLP